MLLTDEIDDDADYDDEEGADLADLETLRMLGEAADDDEVDGGDHSAYPTAWDMQEVDAVVVFGELIQGQLSLSVSFSLSPSCLLTSL